MLDTKTKNQIDNLRDILVGKVPDPKSQVEQITISLMYKFMNDMDEESVSMGGIKTFFTNDYEKYNWSNIFDPKLSGLELVNLYSEAIERMSYNENIPPLFRDIFKNAYIPYKDPQTLKLFLKGINDFNYSDSENLGDAYEYLVSFMGSQGDAGQFRTPRHIIDFMVELINPLKSEKILDPASGTGGFLISSYKHILRTNTKKRPGDLINSEELKSLQENLFGYDISPDMVRMGLTNMYLHNFAKPQIYEYDTLTDETRWNEYFDVIIANPPFMTPKGGINPHNLFSVNSKKSEVLFLDFIVEHLKPNGRACVIVPEGINFVSHKAYKDLRKKIIEDSYLIADITLPHGVFKPYASVKTHILVIDRKLSKISDSILFIDIKNEGFTQSDTRKAIEGSQLPRAIDCLYSYKESITKSCEWENKTQDLKAFQVEKKKLLLDDRVHLIGRWYDSSLQVTHKDDVDLSTVGELCKRKILDIRDGQSPNMSTLPGDFEMIVPAEHPKSADHWDIEGKAVCIPLVSSSGHGKADIKRLHYAEGKFALANTMTALIVLNEEKIIPYFLFIYLSATFDNNLVPLMCGSTNVTMKSEQIADVILPIPEIKIQNEIVQEYITSIEVKSLRESLNRMEKLKINKIIGREFSNLNLSVDRVEDKSKGLSDLTSVIKTSNHNN